LSAVKPCRGGSLPLGAGLSCNQNEMASYKNVKEDCEEAAEIAGIIEEVQEIYLILQILTDPTGRLLHGYFPKNTP
jgi:hypothetical protein